jgi:hypothetical protein
MINPHIFNFEFVVNEKKGLGLGLRVKCPSFSLIQNVAQERGLAHMS